MALKVKIFCLLVLATGSLMFHQNDFKAKLDRLTVDWYDPHIVKDFKMYLFRYNRSLESKVLNASGNLLVDTPNQMMFHVQVYKFSSMEYRLFPINFTMDICKVIAKDTFGTNNIFNYTNRKCCCPFTRGRFVLQNFLLDQSKLPPHPPRGIFKADVTIFFHDNVKVSNGSLYYEIEDLIRGPGIHF